ncbi:hypothetical protein J5N97_029654 [Dioscorea zingiberensis]|uniref:peptide-methionine (S)-S-oxide reductase n=1 Tax=Dioscorea zingiberensis TaxID=325984 RepID=A0A9D5BWG6_9LILI|nr:hypothetical protein J5N97_029654 [Dioscorea zingiberensis]
MPFVSTLSIAVPLSFSRSIPKLPFKPSTFAPKFPNLSSPSSSLRPMNFFKALGIPFGFSAAGVSSDPAGAAIAQGPDDDTPAAGQQFAQFGAGCFWGVELSFQRVPGVTKTEVRYTQGTVHQPTYEDVCTGTTNHSEVVRVQYDPGQCSYEDLLGNVLGSPAVPPRLIVRVEIESKPWEVEDFHTFMFFEADLVQDLVTRQHVPNKGIISVEVPCRESGILGNDVGTQYRSGIYFYTPEQEKAARESLEKHQKLLNRKIVTEILPAKKFYRAEEYHQQYLEKGGRFGFKQSAAKGCNDPIRCYG